MSGQWSEEKIIRWNITILSLFVRDGYCLCIGASTDHREGGQVSFADDQYNILSV